MIFLTTGTQLPFDRLVKAVDNWAAIRPEKKIFAQIGDGKYAPKNMPYVQRLTPKQYQENFDVAELVISHVGMGTIIAGLENAKPLLLMPRKASLGEHRNDHQLGTAEKFGHHKLITIVEHENQLAETLNAMLLQYKNAVGGAVKLEASPDLIQRIREFVDGS